MGLIRSLVVSCGLLAATAASAQETVDIGVLKNSDLQVVQNALYEKVGRTEIGGAIGWMPFDPLVTSPVGQLSIDHHFTETLSLSALIGGGYGFKTGQYLELEGPAYGVAPYAFRYLASALVGAAWAPIYGKLSANGRKVVHYDVYGAARVGGTLEQSVLGDATLTVAPTGSIAIGARFFVSDTLAIRAELRDDLMGEFRSLTSSWHFKQNGAVTLGVTGFLGGGKR